MPWKDYILWRYRCWQPFEPVIKHPFEFHGFFPGQLESALPIVERSNGYFVKNDVEFRVCLDRIAMPGRDRGGADWVQ